MASFDSVDLRLVRRIHRAGPDHRSAESLSAIEAQDLTIGKAARVYSGQHLLRCLATASCDLHVSFARSEPVGDSMGRTVISICGRVNSHDTTLCCGLYVLDQGKCWIGASARSGSYQLVAVRSAQ